MRLKLHRWFTINGAIIINASSLVGTTVVTSGLGFIYWWLAARQFPPEAVGLGSAIISAMMLLGNVGVLGFGTLLIGELPQQPGKAGSLISTALLVVGVAGGGLGLMFALIAPRVSIDFRALAESLGNILLFALGVSLTAITLVLDQAVVGLLRGDLQLWRNAIFAVAKLVMLLMAGMWLTHKIGLTIYASWLGGNLFSLAFMAGYALLKNGRANIYWRPQWGMIRKLGGVALGHHVLNLTLQAPGLMMPIVVTAALSARMNAYFYTAWMIASFAAVAPVALTTVLYAVGAADPTALAHKIRLTLKLSVVVGLLASATLLISADYVLGLFKATYAEQASWSLRILGFGVFPLIIKNHYVVICRIQGRVAKTALFMAGGGLLELLLAVTGARMGGLAGLSLGWVSAICIEALFMGRTVYQVALPREETSSHQSTIEMEEPPLVVNGIPLSRIDIDE